MSDTGIAPEDRWAFLTVARLLSRIRYDDHGHGHIHLFIQAGVITTVEQFSTFKPNGESQKSGSHLTKAPEL